MLIPSYDSLFGSQDEKFPDDDDCRHHDHDARKRFSTTESTAEYTAEAERQCYASTAELRANSDE